MKNWKSREMKREGKWENALRESMYGMGITAYGMFRSRVEVCVH